MSEPGMPPPPTLPPTEPTGLPWERRAEAGGAATAFVETLRRLVLEPGAAFREARRRGELVSPLVYAVLLGWLGVLAERMWGLLIGSSVLDLLPTEFSDQATLAFALSGIGLAVTLILAPIFVLVGLFVWSAVVHLFLMLYGGTRESPSGFEGTLRALSWSSTAQLGQLVPFAGGFVAAIWAVVLQTLGLASLHRTTQGKALAAVLTPLLLCCICVGVFFAGAIALIVGGIASAAGGP